MPKKRGKSKAAKRKQTAYQRSVAEHVQSVTEEAPVSLTEHVPEIYYHPMRVCRLCECRDGPFRLIFDTQMATAKKIEDLMPFKIAENDDLPQKICFRCAAKVCELHEFMEKCVKSHQNLRVAVDRKRSQALELKPVSENNVTIIDVSNVDICGAIIKKALDGIKVSKALTGTTEVTPSQANTYTDTSLSPDEMTKPFVVSPANNTNVESNKNIDTISKVLRLQLVRCDDKVQDKILTRANINKKNQNKCTQRNSSPNYKLENNCQKSTVSPRNLNIDKGEPCKSVTKEMNSNGEKSKHAKNNFDIMDHVNALKVDNVGTMYLCNLCNRNFMALAVVKSHGCAKSGVPKERFTETLIMPAPPKPIVVKYINTKSSEANALVSVNRSDSTKNQSKTVADNIPKNDMKEARKSKPRIGPASKVKRKPNITNPAVRNAAEAVSTLVSKHLVNQDSHFSTVKNRTFALVEEQQKNVVHSKTPMKRLAGDEFQKSTTSQQVNPTQPYPVGLFPTMPPGPEDPPIFTTAALQNKSYTILQTDNPGKIVISTKRQPTAEADVPTKRIRKSKHVEEVEPNQPYSVTLKDAATSKNPGVFQFINVDPLLQPTYVLPTDSTKEQPVISKERSFIERKVKKEDTYTCKICSDIFDNENNLLAHVLAHYNKMNEED